MKKTVLTILIFGVMIIGVVGCSRSNDKTLTDSIRFKEEYEGLNETTNSSGRKHRTLSIPEENPIIYTNVEEIIEKIEGKETFYIYFGSKHCAWCRSVIEKAIEVAKKNNIDTIYYIDIWDGDHIEILRDTYKLNDDGKPELVLESGKGYNELLEYFDNVLSDYVLNDKDGNKVSVGEKRIFAPNFIYVENGKAIKLTEGISKNQTDSRMKLTDEMLEDEEKEFNELFEK